MAPTSVSHLHWPIAPSDRRFARTHSGQPLYAREVDGTLYITAPHWPRWLEALAIEGTAAHFETLGWITYAPPPSLNVEDLW